jgi:hypothetical protein
MPHENLDDDDEAVKAERRIAEHYYRVRDLMPEAIRRQSVKAASSTKKVHDEHRVLVLVAEAFLVVATFGIVRHFRKKSS